MIIQGEWAARSAKNRGAPVRLSHVYTNTKGRPEASKASILMPRERIATRWEYIATAVRTIADVAKETDVEKVPANTNACGAFGGCAYAETCTARSFNSLETFFGGSVMGLMESLNLPVPATSVVSTPVATAAVVPGYDIVAQMAAQAAAVAAPLWPSGFPEAVAEIEAKGYGFPPLAGAAAAAYGAMKKYPPAVGYAGSGDLAGVAAVTDPAMLLGIAADMRPLPVKAPVTLGLVSPETPPSKPELAALPVEGFGTSEAIPGLIASVPAAVAAPIIAANATPPAAAAAVPEAPVKTRKPRGPNKPKTAAPSDSTIVEASETDGLWLFVDCRPNVPHEDLQGHLDTWSSGMAKHYQCNPADVRMAPQDSVLGYGKWKGGLAALAAAAAKTLAFGAYYVDTRGSEVNEAFLEGLRGSRRDDGSPVFELIVRGVK